MHYTIGKIKLRKAGLIWGLWFALAFMLLPYAITGYGELRSYQRYLAVVDAPASDYVRIDYINASDIGHDGVQYMEMCRHVDKERVGDWTWELSMLNVETQSYDRKTTSNAKVIMEKPENCIIAWNSKGDAEYQRQIEALESGRYRWQVFVEFDVTIDQRTVRKELTAYSNTFTKRVKLID